MTAPPQPRLSATERRFAQRFSATRHGARLARRRAMHQLTVWGLPYTGAVAESAAVVVAELAANAATHGRVPGRDFELRLTLTATLLRIEVSDTRTDRRPPGPGDIEEPSPLAESGRGLLLVEALADRWEVSERTPLGKTLRAEIDLPVEA